MHAPFIESTEINEPSLHTSESRACLHTLFEAHAARAPHQIAVTCDGAYLTYGELDARAERLARSLRRAGVGRGHLCALFVPRSLEMIIGILAALKAGAAYVPVDVTYPAERVRFMLDDARPRVVLTRNDAATVLPQYDGRVICIDDDTKDAAEDNAEDNGDELSRDVVTPDDLAYVIYTSGSTGQPKGVQIRHRSAAHLFNVTRDDFAFGSSDVWTVFHSYSFDLSVWEIFGALTNGARLVIVPTETAQSPVAFLELLRAERVTVLNQTPAAINQLWRAREVADPDAATALSDDLRLIICGGEALPTSLARRLLKWDVPVWNFYGPTEATVWTTIHPVAPDDLHLASAPIGRPLAGAHVLVLDEEGQEAANGESGEIHIGGANLALGYLNRPELTAEKFIPHPFDPDSHARLYRTGDLARVLPGGALEYLGRLDHQVKVRGFRIELGEIEAALAAHPRVRDAVVIVHKDEEDMDGRLLAYIVCAEGAARFDDLQSELKSFLKQRLPAHLIPSLFVELEKLPLTSNDKIDRRALPQLMAAPHAHRAADEQNHNATMQNGDMAASHADAMRMQVERRLIRLWERTLKTAPISAQDDFFRLGGDSLLAVQMLLQVEEEFGKRVPPATLITNATIEHLATTITTPDAMPAWSPVVPIKPEGSRPPLFLVHPIGGEVFGYAALAKLLGDEQPVYGLQAYGLDGERAPIERIEEMASLYLDEVLKIQPREPFLFGGYSFGGIVAYEMARQLHERSGRAAALVAVLDEEAPRAARPPAWHPLALARFTRNLPFWTRDSLRGRPVGDIMRAVARHSSRVARTHLARPSINVFNIKPYEQKLADMLDVDQLPPTHRRVSEALHRALTAYCPRPCPVRVTLFRTKSNRLLDTVAFDKGWSGLAQEGVEVHIVAGNHNNMYEQPQARLLAAGMRACLDRIAMPALHNRDRAEDFVAHGSNGRRL